MGSIRTVVGLLAVMGAMTCAICANVITYQMAEQVNRVVEPDSKFGYLVWSYGKYRRLYREHRRLYPESSLPRLANRIAGLFLTLIAVGILCIGAPR